MTKAALCLEYRKMLQDPTLRPDLTQSWKNNDPIGWMTVSIPGDFYRGSGHHYQADGGSVSVADWPVPVPPGGGACRGAGRKLSGSAVKLAVSLTAGDCDRWAWTATTDRRPPPPLLSAARSHRTGADDGGASGRQTRRLWSPYAARSQRRLWSQTRARRQRRL